MKHTGLNPAMLVTLVHKFYDRVRDDAVLEPIFTAHITDWPTHLERMVSFWSSVALMTGTYHGAPVPAHAQLPITWAHFQRWLELFRATATEVCPPKGAAHLVERAERIARSLQIAVENHSPCKTN